MTNLPAHLQPRRRDISEAVAAGLGGPSIPRISLKGQSFTLVDGEGEREEIQTKHLDCIMIDANPNISRTFWGLDQSGQPKQFDDQGLPPICWSDNGIGASVQASEPQSTNCRSCPMSQFNWPSRIDPSKRTSACRPLKKIAVLAYVQGQAVQDPSGAGIYSGELAADFPFALRIPVTSHENLRAYHARFKGQSFNISHVVTRIKFVHGSVGLLDFEAVAFIDAEDNAFVDQIPDSAVDMLIGSDDKPVQQLIAAPQEAVRPLSTAPAAAQAPPPREPLREAAAPSSPSIAPPASSPAPLEASPAAAKRGRPRKAAAPPAEQSNVVQAPFAQATPASAPAAARTAPFATPAAAPNHGIQTDAPPPPMNVEAELDTLFGKK